MNSNSNCYICGQPAISVCEKCKNPICENHRFNRSIFTYTRGRNVPAGTKPYCKKCNEQQNVKDRRRFYIVIILIVSILVVSIILGMAKYMIILVLELW